MIARTKATPAAMINYATDSVGLVAQRLRTLLLQQTRHNGLARGAATLNHDHVLLV
jgi:hypothetical protein